MHELRYIKYPHPHPPPQPQPPTPNPTPTPTPTPIYVYSEVPIWRGLISHDITYDTSITVAKSESDIRITTDAPWGVYCEDFGDRQW